MQADPADLKLLPRRGYGTPVGKLNARSKLVLTNFYEIRLGGKETSLYQMVVDTEPAIPSDSNELIFQLVRSMKRDLRERLGPVVASGKMLWGLKELTVPVNLKTTFSHNDKEYSFEVIVKPTKVLTITDLLKEEKGRMMVFQVFNNKLKGVLRQQQLDELSRGKYFDKHEERVKESGLNVLRGFKFTLCSLKKGMTLQIDVCSRVFRDHNLLEEINHCSKDEAMKLVGSTVITNYGKRKTYSIINIDFSKNPKYKFYHEKRAGKITLEEYYKEAYGIQVKAMNQPLIEVVTRVEKIRNANGTLEKKEQVGFLLPEFISLTGMSDEQRANHNTMKSIAPFTKLTPAQRVTNNQKMIDNLNKGKEIDIGKPLELTAYQLPEPKVKLSSRQFKSDNGSLNFKDKVLNPIKFNDWVMVYSRGKNDKYDDKDAEDLWRLLDKASEAFGIDVAEPGWITCPSNIQSWKKEIAADFDNNGKPQIVVLFFQRNEERFYGELKRFITCELKVPCQVVRRYTVGPKAKNPLSAASKIILQMNQKVGGVIWKVLQDSDLKKTKMMYGAFSISKGKKGFTLAFVGTVGQQYTKVFSYCKTGYPRKEDIPRKDFETVFLNWAKTYVQTNKVGPELILIYREGLSLPQIQVQVMPEIEALRDIIKVIGQKTKKENYRPEVMYVTVNKKINTRMFDTQGSNSQGKFAPKVTNPTSGTCMFEEGSQDERYDFHLTAQKVTQGTCTPTQFIVAYDDSKVPQEALAQFTYEQCFNYYNWQGAVKVPACMQCADKLAKLVGEHIQANVTEGDVLKSFFFL